MKKIITSVCIAGMLCTTILSGVTTSESVEAASNNSRISDIGDALAILRNCVGLDNNACLTTHDFNANGVIDVGDALLVLRGLVGLDEPQIVGVINGADNGNVVDSSTDNTEPSVTTDSTDDFTAPAIGGVDTQPSSTSRSDLSEESLRGYIENVIVDTLEGMESSRAEEFAVRFFAFSPLRLHDLTEFQIPNVRIDGFELYSTSVVSSSVSYEFAPLNSEWEFGNGIQITVTRTDATMVSPSPCATLEEVMLEVSNYTPSPNGEIRNGFLYLPGWNSIMGTLGNTRFEVRVPTDLSDFDFLHDIAQQIVGNSERIDVAQEIDRIRQSES
jgi:hypothetical protein